MIKFNNATRQGNTLSVEGGTPKNPKKITGTRLSKVMGLNQWSTPFQAWCEIMRVAEPPFEGNKYTEAGQAIEPKLIEYCKQSVSPYIVTPEEYFVDGKKRWDFFEDYDIFGGMWDALAFDKPNVTQYDYEAPIAIIEAKTTSRPQDWEDGVPAHYAVQGLLYAYLADVEDVYFPVAFLEPEDYDYPEGFECTDENTRIFHLETNKATNWGGSIEDIVDYVRFEWYAKHVTLNTSPEFDEKKDKEYLKLISTFEPEELEGLPDDLGELCEELRKIDERIEELKKSVRIDELEKQRKEINKKIQENVKPILSECSDKASLDVGCYVFTVSETRKVDYEALEKDGLTERYVKTSKTIRTKKRD